jgi:OmpA family
MLLATNHVGSYDVTHTAVKSDPKLEDISMTEASAVREADRDAKGGQVSGQDDLAELRSLLLAPEQTQLLKLQQRLDDPKFQVEDLSRLLPEAIALRSTPDKILSKALLPVVEESIQVSVKRNPRVLIDAIFPLMGPAIRKAVTTALSGMIQSLNQALEDSFSVRGLKWRLEALRTGKSFAEVVLVHTLLYRVEQVILIHKKTGLLLQHAEIPSVVARDADVVSGMLTAIRDFVQDSFDLQKSETLETLQVGELTVWIEPGPEALLVGVIRGNAPKELRSIFQDAIENIHLERSRALESFQGESTPFEACKPDLEACLQIGYVPMGPRQRYSHLLWLLGLILVALGLWSYFSIRNGLRWGIYVERLNAEPGLVVIAAEKREGRYFILGLRDPLAVDPSLIMQDSKLDPTHVVSRWHPFSSAVPEFVLARSKAILAPPATVTMNFEDGTLHVSGVAPHHWIVESRRLAPFIPGVVRLQGDQLADLNLKEVEAIKKQIERRGIRFEIGHSEPAPNQDGTFRGLGLEARQLIGAAQSANVGVVIDVIGHTDNSGSEETNMKVGQRRAETVLKALVSNGLEAMNLVAIGVSTKEPLSNELTEKGRALNRSVTFRVRLTPVPDVKSVLR